MEKIKQVLLIRRDLKMRRGKEIAQGSHASMDFLIERIRKASNAKSSNQVEIGLTDVEMKWISNGMAKVCLQVVSEDELLGMHEKARSAGLESHLIRDSGKTEFGGNPTFTALAIGPCFADLVDSITGELQLY